ncbi:hypothetical protein HY642_01650 [Candidatus Woesearchaeota archaeon]|nr:hypothetical protein [Candidatus Woesearchaeota archaeon]
MAETVLQVDLSPSPESMNSKPLADNAARFILYEAVTPETGIVASQWFNPAAKKWHEREATIDDFGDYLHYVRWYGDMFNDEAAREFPSEQLAAWERFKMPTGFYASPVTATQKRPSLMQRWRVSLYDHQDGMLGLIELYKQTKDDAFLNGAIVIGDSVCKVALRYHGLIPHEALLGRIASPWTLCFSEVGGLYIENLCNLFALTGEYRYFRTAQLIAQRWLQNKEFQQTGLWLRAVHHRMPWLSYRLKWHVTKPMKDNTNLIFGLLAAYRTTHDERYATAVRHALNGLQLLRAQGYCFWYDFRTARITDAAELLTQNHPVIDAHIEAFRALNEPKYLDEARRLTDVWLARKDKTGLIPEAWNNGQMVKSHCRIDAFTDFHTNCLKLAELTGENKYRAAADDAIRAADLFAGNDEHWWAESVDALTGAILPHPNQTKFVGGPLRYFLLHEHVRKGGKIYGDELVLSLIRDR